MTCCVGESVPVHVGGETQPDAYFAGRSYHHEVHGHITNVCVSGNVRVVGRNVNRMRAWHMACALGHSISIPPPPRRTTLRNVVFITVHLCFSHLLTLPASDDGAIDSPIMINSVNIGSDVEVDLVWQGHFQSQYQPPPNRLRTLRASRIGINYYIRCLATPT